MTNPINPMDTAPLDGTLVVLHRQDGYINVWQYIGKDTWHHVNPQGTTSIADKKAFFGWSPIAPDAASSVVRTYHAKAPIEVEPSRRGQVAIACLAAILASDISNRWDYAHGAKAAVKHADALIEYLDNNPPESCFETT